MDWLNNTGTMISCITHTLLQHNSFVMAHGQDPLEDHVRLRGVEPLGLTDYRPWTPCSQVGVYGLSQVLSHPCPHCGHNFHGLMEGALYEIFTDQFSMIFNLS